jgi:hypothetical protein
MELMTVYNMRVGMVTEAIRIKNRIIYRKAEGRYGTSFNDPGRGWGGFDAVTS